MNHYSEEHEQKGCAICEIKRSGSIGTTGMCGKDCPHLLQLEERTSQLDELFEFVYKLSVTDILLALDLLRENDHAAIAGLVYHFMGVAMSTSMGGD